jgi:hypothetical protein
MPKKPNKQNIAQPKKLTGGGSGIGGGLGSLTDYTNAQDIKARFWTNSLSRPKDKASGDATYWTEGRCNWGGNHNLMEDCQVLANFANDIVSAESDTRELTLSINEQEFNLKKQQLVSKLQNAINQCQVSSSWSIGNICCIWNDYFGSFIQPFINGLKQKMQGHLNGLQVVQPIHQKEILELEAELRAAETKYNDAMANAAKETDPVKKAQFIAIAQEAANTIKQVKAKLAKNPLSKLAEYSYLSDIGRLLGGNLPNNPPTVPSGNPGGNSDPNGGDPTNPSGSKSPWIPFGGSSGSNNNQQQNQQQLILIALAVALILFFLMNQKDSPSHRRGYDEFDYY